MQSTMHVFTEIATGPLRALACATKVKIAFPAKMMVHPGKDQSELAKPRPAICCSSPSSVWDEEGSSRMGRGGTKKAGEGEGEGTRTEHPPELRLVPPFIICIYDKYGIVLPY
jgi:hypothetical protein